MDARKKILDDVGLYKYFKEATAVIPGIEEELVVRWHEQVVLKKFNAHAGTIF